MTMINNKLTARLKVAKGLRNNKFTRSGNSIFEHHAPVRLRRL